MISFISSHFNSRWGVRGSTPLGLRGGLLSEVDMLIITIKVNAPSGQAIGIKEAIAQDLEKYGDVKVTDIKEISPRQERMF